MIFVKLKSAPSNVHGTGCFALASVKRGTVLSFWGDSREVQFTDGKQHARNLRKGSRLTRETAVRVLGELFVQSRRIEDKDPTDYINHSARPNVGYYAGVLFALRNLRRGEELFMDYRLLNAEYEKNVVRGLSPSRQLRESAKQFLKAFS